MDVDETLRSIGLRDELVSLKGIVNRIKFLPLN